MSYVFEIGDELAMPDVTVAVRGLAGGQTLEDAHPAVQHALSGLIEDYYVEWKAIDKRSRSEAEEVENFLPPHIIEKRATLRKQRKEELSKRDTELLEAAVTITASLPFGILTPCRIPSARLDQCHQFSPITLKPAPFDAQTSITYQRPCLLGLERPGR